MSFDNGSSGRRSARCAATSALPRSPRGRVRSSAKPMLTNRGS